MSVLPTCKLDSECTAGKAGGCCTIAKLESLGTPTGADLFAFEALSTLYGLKKQGDSIHYCVDGDAKQAMIDS